MQSACAILSSVARFSKKKVIGHKTCILIFSTTFVVTFLSLRWAEQDMIKNVYWFLCKVPVILFLL